MKKLLKKYNVINEEELNKGWSREKKTILTCSDGTKYLLRESSIESFNKKEEQFYLLKKLDSSINMSRPIDFGMLDNGNVYMLLTYLDGTSLEEEITKMSNDEAYDLGFTAGRYLSKIHKNVSSLNWWDKYKNKIDRKVNAFKNCEYKLEYGDVILDYYINHTYLMENRPMTITHGDFHVGNMIINNGVLGIIDFDKIGYADPYDDLKPFCWNAMLSEDFASGIIDGYFNNDIPLDFFPILKFYTAESLISQMPWSVSFGKKEVETAYKVYDYQMKWYDNFKLDIPRWYKKRNIR